MPSTLLFRIVLKSLLPLAAGAIVSTSSYARSNEAAKPLLRDFIGLNVHTVQFKPKLYRPVIRMVRDYHPVIWDTGDDPHDNPPFPSARNGVNWEDLYGSWNREGYDIDACLMFDTIPPKAWKDLSGDAYAYGFQFARFFGPSSLRHRVASVEIGNEPGNYSDEQYRTLFVNAAQGIRKADPKLLIATCNTDLAPSGSYHKNLELFKGLGAYYDVINLHDYAQAEPYPTWRRSYPEDPSIPYLKQIRSVIQWRDRNAPKKPIWITEFGWDSTTQPQEKEGDFKQWVGVTDTQQAQYLVRSLLVFSSMDVGRAYIFFFDDNDLPRVHSSSGLTRKGVPKPSFYAVAHLQSTLGDYRFSRIVTEKPGDLYVYEYRRGDDPKRLIWVAWSPTGKGAKKNVTLKGLPGNVESAERMPLAPGDPATATFRQSGSDVSAEIDESPLYLKIQAR